MQHWHKIKPREGFKLLGGTRRTQVATMVLTENEKTGSARNHHPLSDQWLYVLAGDGCAVVADQSIRLTPGTVLLIEAGEPHEIRNLGTQPLETLNIYSPRAF